MTRLEIMQANKVVYAKVKAEIATMKDGIEKAVMQTMILEWVKGNNWLGGLCDSKACRLLEKLTKLGYDEDEAVAEYDRQIERWIQEF